MRIGDNRWTNVVDRFGFAHDVPNLGILSASVMGTRGAHDPTPRDGAATWPAGMGNLLFCFSSTVL